ncbi:MAG: hypothetical protein ACREQL_04280 [Candidatus Binatia bacterium]
MLAILAHALRSLFCNTEKPGRSAARHVREDLRWFTSRSRTYVFAFENICEALDLGALRIRERVLGALDGRAVMLSTPLTRPRRGRRTRPAVFVDDLPQALAV